MSISGRVVQNATVLLLAVGILSSLLLREVSGQIVPRNLPPRPVFLPLDNGSLQNNLPGNIATLPLFLRNGGFFGFGSGAFGQLQANPPAGGVIIPQSVGLGAMGAAGGAILGGGGCQGNGAAGAALLGGIAGGQQPQAFFPCSLTQGQFSGALTQRIVQDGFILQYGVAVVPQVLGGIPTLAFQMGSGFGSLKGNQFMAQQQQNMQQNGVGGGVGGIGVKGLALAGDYGCY